MRKATIDENKKCPEYGEIEGQVKNGKNRFGTQSYLCRHCKKTYTLDPKQNAYSEEKKALAIKIYYAGTSGRGVGKILGMSKNNVYRWIKKTKATVNKSPNRIQEMVDSAYDQMLVDMVTADCAAVGMSIVPWEEGMTGGVYGCIGNKARKRFSPHQEN